MRLRGSLIALVTIACFLGLFAYSLMQLITIDRGFRKEIGESNLWAATQADREAQNLMLELYRVGPGGDPAAAMLRYEILYSRIALMLDRPQVDYFRAIGVGDRVQAARVALEDLDTVLVEADFNPAQSADVIARVAELSTILREVTNATALEERIDRHAAREKQLHIMRLLLLSVGGVFLTGLIMAALLWRNMRRSSLAREELRRHRDMLEETVTARTHALNEALEVERRAKEVYRSFIVTISHQFRTPVSIIHMIAQRQLRAGEGTLSGELRRKFSRIFDAATRLERLLNGFLSSASVEGRDITLSRKILDLNDVIVIAAGQTEEANPGRILHRDLAPGPLPVDGDPVLLEQVVLNLLSNAMKYSDSPSGVSLRSWKEGARIFCRVTDFGIGIPPDARDAVFDRFYRAPNVHRIPGAGVGLSLVRDIVSLHGGEVSLTSQLGEGSEFTVALPSLGDAYGSGTPACDDSLHRR